MFPKSLASVSPDWVYLRLSALVEDGLVLGRREAHVIGVVIAHAANLAIIKSMPSDPKQWSFDAKRPLLDLNSRWRETALLGTSLADYHAAMDLLSGPMPFRTERNS